MQVGVLITNGGKHSNEKLAVATAGQIIQIAANSGSEDAVDGRKLENQLIDILEAHHARVSEHEVDSLMADNSHLVKHLDPEPHMDVLDEIIAAGLASKWKKHFEKEDVQQHIRNTIASWTATNMFMHRQAHADGLTGHHLDLKPVPGYDPEHPHVKAWKYKETVAGMGSGLPESITGEALGK
jgi:hypothetical protein